MGPVRQFPHLLHLDLSHNNIRQVDGIDMLTHLQVLNLSHNDLRNFLAIRPLSLNQRRLSKDEQALCDAVRSKPRLPNAAKKSAPPLAVHRHPTSSQMPNRFQQEHEDSGRQLFIQQKMHDRPKQAKATDAARSRHMSLIERKLLQLIASKDDHKKPMAPAPKTTTPCKSQRSNQLDVDALTSIEDSNDSKTPSPTARADNHLHPLDDMFTDDMEYHEDVMQQLQHNITPTTTMESETSYYGFDQAWASCAALEKLFDTSLPLYDDQVIALAQAAAEDLPFQNVHLGTVLREFAQVLSLQQEPQSPQGETSEMTQIQHAADVDMESSSNSGGIDESLYSRQLYVMGHEAQRRMGESNVLIVNVDGLGVEIAKNIVLAGVRSVTLFDDAPATFLDLSAQFYLTEQDVATQTGRAEATWRKLAELNPYVQVKQHTGKLTADFIAQFRVVVVCNATREYAIKINDICHALDVAFVYTESRGVFGSVFCDFGEAFVVSDKDGEQPITCMIASITADVPGKLLVTVTDDSRHQLETGDFVTFREIQGVDGLNGVAPLPITVTGPYTFTIDHPSIAVNSMGGYVTQVKQPVVLQFKPLKESLVSPGEFLTSDFAKFGRSELLHVAFQGLDAFQIVHGHLPRSGNAEDADDIVRLTKPFAHQLKVDVDANVVTALATGARGVVAPITSFLGGIVGQEALKACSGKFTPIHQWFYFDAIECLPDEVLPEAEYQPLNSRDDGQVAVWGRSFQEKLKQLRLFLVGAGAIGCEMLKNWALMGIASHAHGRIHLTDMDLIEKSNLNRQFLFRSTDVGQAKSSTAATAIQSINPHVNIQAYVTRVGADSETTFDDAFYDSLSGVCTALDNVDARLYMDQRCLFYGLPMLESGTLGTKGNTQVVVPNVTENYGASRDPPEKSIPICTLKNFPNAIEHTLQWARDWFEGVYFQTPNDVNAYITTPNFIAKNLHTDSVERVYESLVADKPASFHECIAWARLQFEAMFSNSLKQLLHNFPLDQVTTTGTPFWSGPKRPPTPLTFSTDDTVHMDFVVSVANSRARTYGIVGHRNRAEFVAALETIHVPRFVPRDGVKIAANDEEMKQAAQGQSNTVIAGAPPPPLPSPAELGDYRMFPIEFDKDDDSHMEVIVATSNLRARSYKIQEADLHASRFIAGKIIPAIATTTALVTGLVCLELVKYFQHKPLEAFKNGFVNLALPLFAFSEPIAPKVTTSMLNDEPYKWTAWDRLEMNVGDVTLQEFLKHFESKYGAEVSMLSYGVTILYAMYSAKSRSKERMGMKLSELVTTITKADLPPKQKYLILEVCATDAEGEDLELPYIRYQYRQ
ncbi:hypothetical protein DYB26_003579 [Aphanomyces astaci]|uniref:E1 ubiquitin-activating enzyme n=2 Tax=Aphanomyces astaci TaxID=112090 RepID=A0A397EE80_APHAT|nr:hypothetical protein DYB31_004568 [Aphanomyces astaci]RHZ17225.1 hypothetical protein DYB26_003579 [Aphanomyces astaci]